MRTFEVTLRVNDGDACMKLRARCEGSLLENILMIGSEDEDGAMDDSRKYFFVQCQVATQEIVKGKTDWSSFSPGEIDVDMIVFSREIRPKPRAVDPEPVTG